MEEFKNIYMYDLKYYKVKNNVYIIIKADTYVYVFIWSRWLRFFLCILYNLSLHVGIHI